MYLGKIVELGRPEQSWFEPRHPYSRALMKSVPSIGRDVFPEALEGEVPDPAKPPAGCRFNTRCSFAMDKCRTEEPQLITLGTPDGGSVACWLQKPGDIFDLEKLVMAEK